MSQPQHLEALEQANEVRLAQGALRREIASLPKPQACERVAALLEAPPEHVARMPVHRLLRAIPRIGQTQTVRYLRAAELGPYAETRCVGPLPPIKSNGTGRRQLTERQRRTLAAFIRNLPDWSRR